MDIVKRTERGWAGHFCAAQYCLFHRNTLLEFGDARIIVSTVGNYNSPASDSRTIGSDRTYETMAFHAQWEDPYWDVDVGREVPFDSEWGVWGSKPELSSDKQANEMHEAIVAELMEKFLNNELAHA